MRGQILDKKQVQHTKDEKNVIEMLHHPFVVNMIAAFQDEFNLYLVLEFVNGGELCADPACFCTGQTVPSVDRCADGQG